jgi:hypothetical protein
VYVEVRRKDRNNPAARELLVRLPLYDAAQAETVLPQLLNALAARPLAAPLPRIALPRPKALKLTHAWSLNGLVKEGDVLVLQAFADDYCDIIPYRQPGHSHEVELRVIGKPALAANIDEAQAKIEEHIARLRDMQANAIKKVEGAEKQWRATGKIRPEDAVKIAEAEPIQKQIQIEVGLDEKDGLRGEIARLEQLLKENKVPPSSVHARLQLLKRELGRLADGPLSKIEGQLFQARQDLEDRANAKPPAPKEKNELAKAHDNQKEVKRTLDDLLGALEKWAGLNEFKAELRTILTEQQELKQETEKIRDQFGAGNKLTPEAEQDVQRIASQQKALAGRLEALLRKMERASEDLQQKDPNTSKLLAATAKTGRDLGVVGEMEETSRDHLLNRFRKDPGEILKKQGGPNANQQQKLDPQLNNAVRNMIESTKSLELIIEALEEPREGQLEAFVKGQKEDKKQAPGKLDDLIDRLEKLQKRIEKAGQIADPREREAALEKLAGEERALQAEVQKKARELALLQVPQAAKNLKDAAQKLGQAAEKLEKGQNPGDINKDVKKQIEVAKERTEEELAREIQSRLIDRLRGLKERQDAALVESARLHKLVLQHNTWAKTVLTSLDNLSLDQQGLSKDTASVRKKVPGAVVFDMVLEKAVQSMDAAEKVMADRSLRAQRRIKAVKQAPFTKEELAEEQRLDQLAQRHQRDASKRLERLLENLKENLAQAQKDAEEGNNGGGGGGGGGGGAKARPVDGIPQLAQLKVLREEQQDINRRTLEFAERNPDPNKLDDAQRQELEALQRDQSRLGDLFLKMARAVNGEGANP